MKNTYISMEILRKVIDAMSFVAGKSKTDQLYETFKPVLVERLNAYMDSKITARTKPRTNLDNFADAFYGLLDAGGKYKNLKKYYNIPASSFCGYMKICEQSKILATLHSEMLVEYKSILSLDTISDSFTSRAKYGSECKDYHHKERGKKGTSVSVTSDLNKIPLATYCDSASIDDRELLWLSFPDPDAAAVPIHRMFVDKGYVGKGFKNICLEHNVILISPPKRVRGGKITHTLSGVDAKDLKQHRSKIEQVNSIYRNFRSIDVRYTKRIGVFRLFVDLATVLTTMLNLNHRIKKLQLCS